MEKEEMDKIKEDLLDGLQELENYATLSNEATNALSLSLAIFSNIDSNLLCELIP